MNDQDQDKQKQEEELKRQQAANEVTRRIEELKRNRRKNYDDTDEDDGYHD